MDQWPHIMIKKIFGGQCYGFNGHLVAGVYKDQILSPSDGIDNFIIVTILALIFQRHNNTGNPA